MDEGLADPGHELVVYLHDFHKLPATLFGIVFNLLEHLESYLLLLESLITPFLVLLSLFVVVFEVVVEDFLSLLGMDLSRLRHYLQTLAISHSRFIYLSVKFKK